MKHLLLFISLAALSVHGFTQTIIDPLATVGRAPLGMVFDPSGNLYVVNTSSSTTGGTISKILPDGTVTLNWATISTGPASIYCDLTGNIYTVNNASSKTICKITPDGNVTKFALPDQSVAQYMVADPAGNLYVTIHNGQAPGTIIKITPGGVIYPDWATVGKGPTAIAIDADGNLYTANELDNAISKVTPGGVVTLNWATIGGVPRDILIGPSGNLFVCKINESSICKITPTGEVIQDWAKLASGARPTRLAIDGLGNIYTANNGNSTISKITPGGTAIQNWAKLSESNIYLKALAIDKANNIYTANQYANTVIKIIPPAVRPNKGVLYVDEAAAAGGDGYSWTTALTTLQDGLNAADTLNKSGIDSVHQIWVAKGIYKTENGLSFSMLPKVKIYGSFVGTEFNPAQRAFANTDTSILSGNGAGVIRNDYNGLDTSAWLDGFKITGGTALDGASNSQYGGGIYNRGSSPTLSHLTITGNTAADVGGGMLNDNGAAPFIRNVIFSNNTGGRRGGGGLANFSGSDAVLINVLFFHNLAVTGDGGALYNSNSKTKLINTTISGNTAAGRGGAVYNTGASGTLITNSIIWGNYSISNTGHEIASTGSGVPVLANSIYQNGPADIAGDITINGGNMTGNPMFSDTTDADYRLKNISPAIDAGDNSAIEQSNNEDLAGNQRIYHFATNGKVDIGAYEFQGEAIHVSAGILYVDSAAAPDGNGSSWSTALTSFADALSAAKTINENAGVADSVRQIWVARGTYQPVSDEPFYMLPKVKIYGSFAGTESELSQRNLRGTDTSILKGNGFRVLANVNNNLDTSARLDGFEITGGQDKVTDQNGGGIYNRGSSPAYSNLVFTGNNATYGGGGMAIYDECKPLLTNIVFRHNEGGALGAGGGGLYVNIASPVLTNVLFENNTSSGQGGALFLLSPKNITLTNVTITANKAVIGGGIVYINNSNTVMNVNNSIIWGNLATQDPSNEFYIWDIYGFLDGEFNHVILKNETGDIAIRGGYNLRFTDTLQRDPQFVNPAAGDFRLNNMSPAIDQGDNGLLPENNLLDLAGNKRIVNDIVDLGAYEYQAGTLPVELDSFAGQLQNQLLHIGWKSAIESNLDHYEIEKSIDAATFTYLARQQARGSNNRYLYNGIQQESTAYYRLKSVDNGGKYSYSAVITLFAGHSHKNPVLLYPNPARNTLNIRSGSAETLNIYTVSGSRVQTLLLKPGINSIDISGLSTGLYFGVINGQRVSFIKK